MDGSPVTAAAVPTAGELAPYLERPPSAVAPEVLEALDASPIDPADAVSREHLDRLLDPAPLAAETGWCRLEDGVSYVQVRTEMPGVTAEMVDWWFEWHPSPGVRYQLWYPGKHQDNRWTPGPGGPGRKLLWGSTG
jgi:phloretin hydrolase